MAIKARIVIPCIPHHVIQRGNRSQKVFFTDSDRRTYLNCIIEYALPAGIEIWAYCLMDNHVHLIAVPKRQESLTRGFSEAHRRYTVIINLKNDWRGYLWQGRFKSYPLSLRHLYAAVRYVERNPVRANLVKNAWDYPWSSARAHIYNEKNNILHENFLTHEISDWKQFIDQEDQSGFVENVQHHTNNGRLLE